MRSIVCSRWWLVLALLAASASAAERTWHDALRERIAFDKKYVIDAYAEHGKRDAKWDQDVMRFLEAETYAVNVASKHLIYQPETPVMPVRDRAALAHRILDAGCDDTMVIYQAARALDGNGEKLAAVDLFRRADETWDESGYCDVYRLLAIRDWVDRRGDIGEGTDALEAMRKRFRQALKSVLSDKQMLSEFRVAAWEKLLFIFEDADRTRFLRVAGEVENIPDPDPWLFGTYMGKVEIARAWEARGGGWADSVTEEGWKGFAEHLAKARAHLERAASADERLPHPLAFLITVAMGQSDDALMRESFESAIARQLDFTAAYTTYVSSLTPRWGGSYEQMMEVGLDAARTRRYDTRTPTMLLEVIERIESDHGAALNARQLEAVYPEVEAMFDGYIASPTHPDVARWARTSKMVWAFKARKWDVAREMLDALNGQQHPDVLNDYGLDTYDTKGLIYAKTSDSRREIDAATEQSDPVRRQQQFEKILKALPNDDPVRPWLQRKLESAKFEAQLASGEWVDYPAGLDAWRMDHGKWKVDDQGALIGEATGGLTLVSKLEMPASFELRCDVECLKASGLRPRQAFVSPGWAIRNGISVYLDLDARSAMPAINRRTVIRSSLEVNEPVAKLHVGYEDQRLTLFYDGRIEGAIDLSNVPARPTRRLSIGSFSDQVGTVWKFTNIQVRKLEPR